MTATPSESLEPFTSGDRRNLLLILALCFVVLGLRWVKLDALTYNDPSMWLSQVGRFANGEAPYRDFSWNYPPLSILLLGWIGHIFGPTFGVMQAAIDILSITVVLLSYWVVRYCLPRALHFVTVACLVGICSTALTKFNLFSFSTYSPSLQLASAGLLLMLAAGLRHLRRSATNRADFSLLALGSFLASASKPEAMLAAWGAILLLAGLDRSWTFAKQPLRNWAGYYAALLAAAIIPALAMYGAVALWVGLEPLALGISGYGLASFACPWWPTGLGAFGALAATGEAVFLVALVTIAFRRDILPQCQRAARYLWIGAIPGLLVFAGYVWYLSQESLGSSSSLLAKARAVAENTVWTSPVLLPVMWGSIWLFIWLLMRPSRWTASARGLLFLLSVPAIMSGRGLFGTTLFPFTEVSAMCYPFLVIVAPCLLWKLFEEVVPSRLHAGSLLITAVLGGYAVLRFVAAYPTLFSNGPYESLPTNAGVVRLSDNGVSAAVYRYVVKHTAPGDPVLDLPYGGGFNFASGRPVPIFTSQFRQLRMPMAYQNRDLDQFTMKAPKLVIALNETHYGSLFGHDANMNCTFPHLQWEPTEPSWTPGYVFPVVGFIEQNYKVEQQIGTKLILVPR